MSGYNKLKVAVEDRFIVLRLKEDKAILPEGLLLENLTDTLAKLSGKYDILCDWRGLNQITNDVTELLELLSEIQNTSIIAKPEEADLIRDYFPEHSHILEVKSDSTLLNYESLSLEYFDDNSSIIDIDMTGEVTTANTEVEKFLSILRRQPTDSYGYNYERIYQSRYDHSQQNRDKTADEEDEEDQEMEIEADLDDDDDHDDYEESDYELDDYVTDHTLPSLVEKSYYDEMLQQRINYLNRFILNTGRNSLLNEFVIQERGERVLVTPYHSHALYPIEANNRLIIGKPGIIAQKTGALFAAEISAFQQLLSARKLRESSIQAFLEQHTNILRLLGANYTRIYPQIILERDDGTSLRPDFILQPSNNGWCDILDIKLPDEAIVIGGKDRKRFSSAVEELVAQLREYAAYYEDPRLAKRIQDVYGIKCYRPRMIGVIGRTPRVVDDRQMRRLETIYDDLSIITFDRLVEIAKTRLLV
jgi:hypothetical protein